MTDIFDKLASSEGSTTKKAEEAKAAFEPAADTVQYTNRQLKEATQELLKYGLLEMEAKPNLYRIAQTQSQQVNDILEPLDLAFEIDDVRGLAYIVVAEHIRDSGDDEWSHPLVRRQRLNLEQSLLLAILRQHYIAHEQESGLGALNANVGLDELLPQLQVYLGDPGSEQAEDNRLRNLLDKLKGHGVVSEVDRYDRVTIRPIITHLADVQGLQSMLDTLKQLASTPVSSDETGE
jgi:hypothetical protein